MPPSVIIAADQEVLLEGLTAVLSPEFEIVGRAEDGRQLVELAVRIKPNAVVTDFVLPMLNGIDAARQLRQPTPKTKIVVLTGDPNFFEAKQAFDAGVSAYVAKTCECEEIVRAVTASLTGRVYVSAGIDLMDLAALRASGRRSQSELSTRQRQVLQLLAEGGTGKEIAHAMGISTSTVEFHKATIMTKIGVRTSAELIHYAVKRGLVASRLNRPTRYLQCT